jgi:RNA polymerase sigma factor (TIGR02999 family)
MQPGPLVTLTARALDHVTGVRRRSKAARRTIEARGELRILVFAMNEVTRVLSAIERGDRQAAAQLLPLVYDQLRQLAARKLAQEKSDHTLQATALVHEAYLRLIGPDESEGWDGRGHFYAAAAVAMRRILIERARRRKRQIHGGGRKRVDLEPDMLARAEPSDDVLALDAALDKLAQQDPLKVRLVELRYFAGISSEEAARILGISPSTADRHWAYARAWLRREIAGSGSHREKKSEQP